MTTTDIIRLDAVSKWYRQGEDRRSVLDQASVSIREGEFITIRGRSGSGKTTLLNLLAGLDLPSRGEIWIDGTDLTALGDRGRTLFRRAYIGIVFQFFNLIPTLTALENVRLPLELTGQGPDAEARAIGLLKEVGLAGREREAPENLSGGEQQRVAIARALIKEPRLLLADEPTGNLDRDTGEHVLDLLEELTRARGKTLIVATHSRQIAERADRVLTIRSGKLVAADE